MIELYEKMSLKVSDKTSMSCTCESPDMKHDQEANIVHRCIAHCFEQYNKVTETFPSKESSCSGTRREQQWD